MPNPCVKQPMVAALSLPPSPVSEVGIQPYPRSLSKRGTDTEPGNRYLNSMFFGWKYLARLPHPWIEWSCLRKLGWSWMNLFKKKIVGGWLENFIGRFPGHFLGPWLYTIPVRILCLFLSLASSVKRSNCYMVWGGDIVATSQRSSRSNVDLEIGCLVDLAMGMLSFSANGRELGTCYQVRVALGSSQQCPQPVCLRLCSSFSRFNIPTTAWAGWWAHVVRKPSRKRNKNQNDFIFTKRKWGNVSLFIDWSDKKSSLFMMVSEKWLIYSANIS